MTRIRNTLVDGKIVDVVTPEEYWGNKQIYANTKTAIEETGENGEKYILPYRGQNDDRPGIYDEGCIYYMKFPQTEEEEAEYNEKNLNIIDFSSAENAEDFINKTQQLRDLEAETLTEIDDVFSPEPDVEDTTSMRLLKEAVSAKHCDINRYGPRFGDNFLNNKRLFKQHRISIDKLLLISEKLDMEVEMIIRDRNPDVPNPMGKEIRAVLTGGGESEDD